MISTANILFYLLSGIKALVITWTIQFLLFSKRVLKKYQYQNSTTEKQINDNIPILPRSVNYHFTRQCNYSCGFCFHTAKTSEVLPLDVAKQGLRLLKQSGMEKLNFSGGEPFIYKKGIFLGQLITYCKQELNLPSVSVVSNGSLITESWFQKYGKHLDILAISCDSFDDETNCTIGRMQKRSKLSHIEKLQQIRSWCQQYKVLFKINTVVNTYNVEEDMVENIISLNPIRWKVFQCLLIDGENIGPTAKRQAEKFYISDVQFDEFLQRHKDVACLVPESNEKMQNSYLILDEKMRFLDCRGGAKTPSNSLIDVGVEDALNHSGFDKQMFLDRGGVYRWSKEEISLESPNLEW